MVAVLCVCASVRPCVSPLAAQDNPVIRSAVQLAALGQGDSARSLVARELARARAGDAGWVEALFWRGRLAIRGDSAERDFRRVALEHPNSPWADDALLELAQLALAAGNPAAAIELAARLRADYPGGPLGPRAALWAGRASFEVGEPRGACALLDTARAEAGPDVEFVNQVEFYRARCASLALAAPPREAPAPRLDSSGLPSSVPPRPLYAVQVFAGRTADEADGVVRRLAQAELQARVVVGDGYHRVRLGPFATEREARDASAAARRVLGGAPFIVREP